MEVNKAQGIRTKYSCAPNDPVTSQAVLRMKYLNYIQHQYYKDQAKLSCSSQTLQEGKMTNTNLQILSLHF